MIFSKDDRRHVPATGPLGRGKRNLRSAALALALAVVTAAPASASVAYDTITNWRLQWYPAWGYLTSSASVTVQWTWNPWTGHKVAQITSGSAYSRSTFGPGCLRVKAEAFYWSIGWKAIGLTPSSDGFATICSSHTSVLNLQGIEAAGYMLAGLRITTCWSRYGTYPPINCDSDTAWAP